MTRRKLFLMLTLPILLSAQVPTQFPSGTIQNSGSNSMYESSIDNLVNSQQGEFIAGTISQDLAGQASQAFQNCDSANASQDPDCLMSSTLLGMKELTDQSAASFNTQARVAQSNVCVFASQACGSEIPNPYSSLSPRPSLSALELEELIRNLDERGFRIQPTVGVVKIKGIAVINPASPESIKKNLGDLQNQKLVSLIKSLEKRAIQLASKLTKSQVIKKLGLNEYLPVPQLGNKKSDHLKIQQLEIQNNMVERQSPETLVSSFLGEPVGIGPASLFKIVKKRYGIKIDEKTFLPTK